MQILIMAAQLILGLSLLVFVHEFGHFAAAKFFGMRVPKFFIFFDAWGKKLWSKTIGETEYGIGWLPLGGYVQIAGMVDETQDASKLSAVPEPWEFRAKPAWQRFIVMIGGIVMNIITGILIFMYFLNTFAKQYLPMSEVNREGIYAYAAAQEIGLQTGDKIIAVNGKSIERFEELKSPTVYLGSELTVERNGKTVKIQVPSDFFKRMQEPFIAPMREKVILEQVPDTSNAAKAGLKDKDELISLADQKILRSDDVRNLLKNYAGDTIAATVLRNNAPNTVQLPVSSTGKMGVILASSYDYPMKPYTFGNSFWFSIKDGYDLIVTQILSIRMMFSGQVDPREAVSSPIGIAKIYGGEWDWARFWRITGLLSFVLAFMNILPIPALDGGHMLIIILETILGRKFSDRTLEIAQTVGMLMLLGLMIFAFGNDIFKMFK